MKLTFSELLYFHRARLGLSQAAVSKMFEVALRTLWAWEAGVNSPRILTQRLVVTVLESFRAERPALKVRMRAGRKPGKQSSSADAIVYQGTRPTLSGGLSKMENCERKADKLLSSAATYGAASR